MYILYVYGDMKLSAMGTDSCGAGWTQSESEGPNKLKDERVHGQERKRGRPNDKVGY